MKRHAEGVKRLNETFGWSEAMADHVGLQHGKTKPIRLRPGVPPRRDAYHQRRHRKRKLARAARKANRS